MLAELRDVVDLIAASITDSPDAALFLGDLAGADQYTHRHSVNVTALGLLLGRAYWRTEGWVDFQGRRRWDRIDERLAKLGMGLLLHDIGKMVVPAEVLNKPGKLADGRVGADEDAPGGRASRCSTAPRSARSCAASCATTTSAGTAAATRAASPATGSASSRASRRSPTSTTRSRASAPTRRPRPPHVGVRVITDGLGQRVRPRDGRRLPPLVMPFPVGTEVTLPDGRIGVVAAADAERPYEPLVRVDGDELRVDMAAATAAARGRLGAARARASQRAQLRVDRRVVEQREVVRAADVQAVLLAERDPAAAAAAGGAGRQHERVADQPPERMVARRA